MKQRPVRRNLARRQNFKAAAVYTRGLRRSQRGPLQWLENRRLTRPGDQQVRFERGPMPRPALSSGMQDAWPNSNLPPASASRLDYLSPAYQLIRPPSDRTSD